MKKSILVWKQMLFGQPKDTRWLKNSMKDYEHIAKHKRTYFFKSINELPEGN